MADQPSNSDYLSESFIPLLCKGYHPKYNPKKDYKAAKQPVFEGWNSPGYVPPTFNEIQVWQKAGAG